MQQAIFKQCVRASMIGAMVIMSVTLAGCGGRSLTAGGVGGPKVTRVDASELPGPEGQVGNDQRYAYRIGPYDKLIIDVFGVEGLTDRRLTADGSGSITLPVAGAINLNDLTVGEATDRVTQQLRAGYIRNPRVSVNLEQSVSRFVTVDGEVKQAGNYPIVAGMTLMRGVAAAQGAGEFAKLQEVVIHRKVQGQQMIALYDLQAIRRGAYADPVLYPGDIIVVGDSPGRRLVQQLVSVAPLLVAPLIGVLDNNQ
jgi:polysaccharide export outer membrane protein